MNEGKRVEALSTSCVLVVYIYLQGWFDFCTKELVL